MLEIKIFMHNSCCVFVFLCVCEQVKKVGSSKRTNRTSRDMIDLEKIGVCKYE